MKSKREQILKLCEFDIRFACEDSKKPWSGSPEDSHFIGMKRENKRLTPFIEAMAERIEQLEGALGCHSHSCRLVKPKGMGVNGPCRCIDNIKHVLTATSPLDKLLEGE